MAPTGAKSSGVKRVQITDDMDAVVQLGLLATPTPVPPYTGGYVLPAELDALDARVVVLEAGGGGGGGGVTVHNLLTGRSTADAHPTSAITGLDAALDGKAATSHTHTASQVSDSTTTGRSLLTAADAAAARTTLALGTAATTAATAYATAAQGGKADSASQPGHTHAGADITSGTVAYARLPVGTTASTVAAGDDSRIGKIGGTVTVTGTPTAGQVPVASSGTAAAWGTVSGGSSTLRWSGVGVGGHLPVWANGGHDAFAMVTTRIIPCPLVAVEAMNVDAVSIYVDTGVATSTVDLALYTYNATTGVPGSFVQHLATIDTSTTGLKTATFAPIALAAGIHVVMGRANTANVTLWGVMGSIGVVRMSNPAGGSNQYWFPHATWTGTVPSWPTTPTWDWDAGVSSLSAVVPKLQLRRSA